MNRQESLRGFIYRLCFAAAVLVAAVLLAFRGLEESSRYRTYAYTDYMRSLNYAVEAADTADRALASYLCAGTDRQRYEQAAHFASAVSQCKLALSTLPCSDDSRERLGEYLSEISELIFDNAATRDSAQENRLIAANECISAMRMGAEEYYLSARASTTAAHLDRLLSDRSQGLAGELMHRLEETQKYLSNTSDDAPPSPSDSDIFDQSAKQSSADTAINDELCLIKQGYAAQLARDALTDLQKKHTVLRSAELSGGEYTFVYVLERDDILYYGDCIRVSVSCANGSITRFEDNCDPERTAFDFPKAKTRLEAEKRLSRLLTVENCRTVITDFGDGEVMCYEFDCVRWDGGYAMVYINAATLAEERIILTERTDDFAL